MKMKSKGGANGKSRTKDSPSYPVGTMPKNKKGGMMGRYASCPKKG